MLAHGAEVRHSYFYLVFPDFLSVVAAEGRQFVFVSVDVSGGSDLDVLAIDDFTVAVGEQTYPGETEGVSQMLERTEQPYSRTRQAGRMRFELPAPVGDGEVKFQLENGEDGPVEWGFDPALVARLREPPAEFEVRDFEAPEEVDAGEPIEVSATVANVGEGSGTFRAALNQEGDVMYGGTSTTFEMEAGEERVWDEAVDTHAVREEAVTVHLRFRSSGGDVDRDIGVEPTETPTN